MKFIFCLAGRVHSNVCRFKSQPYLVPSSGISIVWRADSWRWRQTLKSTDTATKQCTAVVVLFIKIFFRADSFLSPPSIWCTSLSSALKIRGEGKKKIRSLMFYDTCRFLLSVLRLLFRLRKPKWGSLLIQ